MFSHSARGLHLRAMRFITLFLLLFGLSSAATESSEASELSEFTPCRIGLAPRTLAAECATLSVSFTHDLQPPQPTDQEIPTTYSLSIARIPARSKQPESDPVTIIAGGPGQGAQDSWPQLANAFRAIQANRDVYLVDQRGTGNSGAMRCPTPPPGTGFTIDLTEVRQTAKICYDKQPQPTQWFTTSVAVRDLDAVRKALDVQQWNIYGVSYGTRVALHYLRRYPQHTRSVIVDAVVPPQKPIGPELPLHAQQSLDALFERCEANEGCAKSFPQLATKTQNLFDSLQKTPREVQFENLSKGSLDTMSFTNQHLSMSVRLLSYSAYGTAILPSMLHDAAVNSNLAPFARQVALQDSQLGGSMATGMHAAVICTEDAPYIDATADRTKLKATFIGDYIVDAMIASCEPWPLGVIDDDFRTPVTGDVPVLALSGDVDPITPPSYADLAISKLSNAYHIINPHQAHTQAPLGCMPTVLKQFIETKSPAELNLECLDRLSPPALFVDANGPLP